MSVACSYCGLYGTVDRPSEPCSSVCVSHTSHPNGACIRRTNVWFGAEIARPRPPDLIITSIRIETLFQCKVLILAQSKELVLTEAMAKKQNKTKHNRRGHYDDDDDEDHLSMKCVLLLCQPSGLWAQFCLFVCQSCRRLSTD